MNAALDGDQPVVSILIPTYNRADCLAECLDALSKEDVVAKGSDVEVLISDNCSTDGTQAVCEEFARRFPDVFVYVRQPRNIGPSDNFTYLLEHGRGKFLKFQQDRYAVEPGVVGRIVEAVKRHEKEHPVLFFGNDYMFHLPLGVYPIRSFDELLDTVSYWTTWIGGYGFWRDEVEFVVPLQNQYAASLLQQVAVILSLFERNRVGYLYNLKQYHDCKASRGAIRGYNVAKVFSQNYLGILRTFLGPGKITKAAFEREKKRLYFGHVYGMYFDFEHCTQLEKGHFFKYTKEFHGNWYYWGSLVVLPVFMLVGRLPPSVRQSFFNLMRMGRKLLAGS